MEWTYSPVTQVYTLIGGVCHVVTHHMVHDGWAASITGPNIIEGPTHFHTLEAAQAWAVTRLAELHAQGKC